MPNHDDTVWQNETIAERYLKGMRAAIPGARVQFEVLDLLLRHANRSIQRVLDLGCGDGILGHFILNRYPVEQAVCIDFSAAMLDAARRRLADYKHATILKCDYGDPAWVESVAEFIPFDAVVSGYSIHHQPDARKREIYAEIFGLLAPGGVFVNIEHVAPESELGGRFFEEHFIDNLHAIEQAQTGPRTREQLAVEFRGNEAAQANILAPVEPQLDWLRQIGYANVVCPFRLHELAILAGYKLA